MRLRGNWPAYKLQFIFIFSFFMFRANAETNRDSVDLSVSWACEVLPCADDVASLKPHLKFVSQKEGISFNEHTGILRIDAGDGKRLHLESNLDIKAHIIEVYSDIVTHGNKLSLTAFEIHFKNGLKRIIGFDNSAPGTPGFDVSKKDRFLHGTGLISQSAIHLMGEEGGPGISGKSGHLSPESINLLAIRIIGNVHIDGNGQMGGQGQQGGMGGHGSHGAKGAPGSAHANALGRSTTSGGQGYQGSYGGLGGKGGTGGSGGKNIPVFVFTSVKPQNLTIQSNPGEGGAGGRPGPVGLSGNPGPGGDGARDVYRSILVNRTAVADGGLPATPTPPRPISPNEFNERLGLKGPNYSGVLSPVETVVLADEFGKVDLEKLISEFYAVVSFGRLQSEFNQKLQGIASIKQYNETLSKNSYFLEIVGLESALELIRVDHSRRLSYDDVSRLVKLAQIQIKAIVNQNPRAENILYHKSLFLGFIKSFYEQLLSNLTFNLQEIEIDESIKGNFLGTCDLLSRNLKNLGQRKISNVERLKFEDLMLMSYCGFQSYEAYEKYFKQNYINGKVYIK